MSEQKEKIFADGMFAKKRDGAPDFVVTELSIKVSEFVPFLQKHEKNSGYVNISVLLNKNGDKHYCELNTWQPNQNANANTKQKKEVDMSKYDDIDYPEEDINPEDIPF